MFVKYSIEQARQAKNLALPIFSFVRSVKDMGEGLKKAFRAAKATRKPKLKVKKIRTGCQHCGAAFIMGMHSCPACGQQFP